MTNNNKTQIKQLEWDYKKWIDDNEEWRSVPIPDLLRYIIRCDSCSLYYRLSTNGGEEYGESDSCNSLEEAKAKAQADFEAKIKPCLIEESQS